MNAPTKLLVCVDGRASAWMALYYAAKRAQRMQAHLEMLHVLDMAQVGNFISVVDRVKAEHRAAAVQLMQECAQQVHQWSGLLPGISIEEGVLSETILAMVDRDTSIRMVILGISQDGILAERAKFMASLLHQLGRGLCVPLLFIPFDLTEQQVDALL